MWFSFPQGSDRISIERQQFGVEFTDEHGTNYFRAPDHFAPTVLAFKGFRAVDPPTADIADLPPEDPQRDATIGQLVGLSQAQADEVRNLREDLLSSNAKVLSLVKENTDLKVEVERGKSRIIELEEELADANDRVQHLAPKK